MFNNPAIALEAALAGFGLTYLITGRIQTYLESEQRVQALADW